MYISSHHLLFNMIWFWLPCIYLKKKKSNTYLGFFGKKSKIFLGSLHDRENWFKNLACVAKIFVRNQEMSIIQETFWQENQYSKHWGTHAIEKIAGFHLKFISEKKLINICNIYFLLSCHIFKMFFFIWNFFRRHSAGPLLLQLCFF